MKPVAIIGGGHHRADRRLLSQTKPYSGRLCSWKRRIAWGVSSRRSAATGYLAEFGPNSILETSPVIAELVRDWVWKGGGFIPIPPPKSAMWCATKSPVACSQFRRGFSHGRRLFSLRPSCAFWRSRSSAPVAADAEESIAQFVERRLGRSFWTTRLILWWREFTPATPAAFRAAGLSETARAGATVSFAHPGANPGRARTQAQRRGFQTRARKSFPSTTGCRC
jgi:hypothetical protein